LNPENVFPSLLVIPTVNVDKSGVMITKGITSGDDDDITVAFSRGAGGAVEGQSAETYLLTKADDNILIFPSREIMFNVLPEAGGSTKGISYFQNRIIKQKDLDMLRALSSEIKSKLNTTGNNSPIGPQDIELGFKDGKIWLFQIRPFVENKNAAKSEYLESITPDFPVNKKIDLKQKI
jgi:phosphoenolpyruvate synthase/pyruvate phosphate dikinase